MIRKTLRLAGHLLFMSAWALLTVSLVWPRLTPLLDNTPAPRPPAAGGVNYLIVAPEGLKASAEAWAAYRRERGYAVQVFTLPPGLPSGQYILEAVAVKNNATLVGSRVVYLGWPPVGEALMSTVFWWLVVSAGLLWKIVPRSVQRMALDAI